VRSSILIFAGAALAGCAPQTDDSSIPPESEIARLEAALSNHPCVGDLNSWERNYRISRKAGWIFSRSINPDLDVIEFHLRKSGTITISSGRKVVRWSENGDWPDSRTVEALDGRYHINGARLSLSGCKAAARKA
jgi:hypothetical protein